MGSGADSVNEMAVVRHMLGKREFYRWDHMRPEERMRSLGAACFILRSEARNPAKSATHMAYRIHAAYTAYCMHAMSTIVHRNQKRARVREMVRYKCRAWEDEREIDRTSFRIAGTNLYLAFARERAKKSA